MTDDQRLLANAVLDGVAGADERARALADAEVQAELHRLRTARGDLAAVEPLAPDRRATLLAAAIAAFTTTTTTTTTSTSTTTAGSAGEEDALARARATAPRRRRWLVPAAAALVAVAVGSLVARNAGDDEDGAADADIQADVPADVAGTGGDVLLAEATLAGRTELAAQVSPATESAATATAGAGGDDAATVGAADASLDVVATPAELAAYVAARTSGVTSATADGADVAPDTSAPSDTQIAADAATETVATNVRCAPTGAATFVATVGYGTPAVAVEVFLATDDVIAMDALTCDVVVVVSANAP